MGSAKNGGITEAINNAQAGQENTDCLMGDNNGPDIISLPPGATLTYGTAFGLANGLNALPNISTPITIEGNGATVEGRDDADFRLIHVAETGDLTIDDLTLSGGEPVGNPTGSFPQTSDGGAVLNYGTLRLNGATVSGNSAHRDGGGIVNRGTLAVTDSTISGNTADRNGGGLYNFAATASVNNSTVSGNSSGQGAGGILSAYATLTVDQSTVSGNAGTNSAGGITNFNATLTMRNSTIAANASSANTGGLRNQNGAVATLTNNLIAGQTNGPNCYFADPAQIILDGSNLADDGSCTGFTQNSNAGVAFLAPLADNGGPTRTHALRPFHPGIDASTSACPPPNTDQRGVPRPLDGDNGDDQACDIGAFEYVHPDSDDDNDRIPNGYETDNGLDPFDNTGDNGTNGDPDGDGLVNFSEAESGAAANNPDSDDDGLGDAIDRAPTVDSNACIPDNMSMIEGAMVFDTMAPSGMITQCASDVQITVRTGTGDPILETPDAMLQLFAPNVIFDVGVAVPMGPQLEVNTVDPVPGGVP